MHPDQFRAPTLMRAEDSAATREQALQRLMETTDYVSRRALQLDEQVQEVEHIVLHLSALARQLRTLASNTSLEATRMRMSAPLAEIARQMRRLSQQVGESNDQLGLTLRSYTVSTGELRQAATSLLHDAKAIQESAGPSEPVEKQVAAPPSRPTALPRWQVTPPYHTPEIDPEEQPK
jgi:methyl-accepting chemotaxis protein